MPSPRLLSTTKELYLGLDQLVVTNLPIGQWLSVCLCQPCDELVTQFRDKVLEDGWIYV